MPFPKRPRISHVHIDRDEAPAKFWLDPVAVAKSRGFRAHELNTLAGMVEEHGDRSQEAWNEYFS